VVAVVEEAFLFLPSQVEEVAEEEVEVGDLPCFQLALHLVAGVVEEAEVEVHFSTAVEALAQVVAEAIQFLP
jgi:hypothetical protein